MPQADDAFVRLTTTTIDGVDVRPLYVAEDVGARSTELERSARGCEHEGRVYDRVARGWSVQHTFAHGDQDSIASDMHVLAQQGLQSAWIELDASLRTGVVGHARDGVLLTRGGAVEPWFRARLPVFVDAGVSALPLTTTLARTLAAHELHALAGGVLFDPAGTLARYGDLAIDWSTACARLAATSHWARTHAPSLRTALVSTVPHHDAGAAPVDELAIAMATGVALLRALTDRGVDPATAADQLIFRFAVASDMFSELAKLRAARALWSTILAHAGVRDGGACLHVTCSRRTWTRHDVWCNALRGTVQAVAAACAGVEAIAVRPFAEEDAGLAARLCMNTQHLLRDEAHLHRVADPGGGSHFVEAHTDALCAAAWEAFTELERSGGIVEALRRGDVQSRLQQRRAARQHEVHVRKQAIVGTSVFANVHEPAASETTVAVAAASAKPDGAWLEGLDGAADPIAWLAQHGGSSSVAEVVGHIVAKAPQLRVAALPQVRDGEAFERVRARVERNLDAQARPRALVVSTGSWLAAKPAMEFACELLETGGIVTRRHDADLDGEGFATLLQRERPHIVALSGEVHEGLGEWIAAARAAGVAVVCGVGRPEPAAERRYADEIALWLHRGVDVPRALDALLDDAGVA